MIFYILCILLGASVGFSSALLGIGGGLLMVPLLPFIFDSSIKIIVFSSVLISFFTVGMNSYFYARSKVIDYQLFKKVTLPMVLGAVLGMLLNSLTSDQNLTLFLFFMLLFMSLRFLYLGHYYSRPSEKENNQGLKPPKELVGQKKRVFQGLFSLAGGLSGYCGIGSGLITNFLFINGPLTHKNQIAPTSGFVLLFTNISAVLSYFVFQSKEVLSPLLEQHYVYGVTVICLFSFVGGYLGRRVQFGLSLSSRSYLLGVIQFILSLKLCWDFVNFL